jgi:hypothetical protein
MKDGYTVKEIAKAVGVTEMTVWRQSQSWNGVKRTKGKGLMYPLEALPEKIQEKLRSIYKDTNDVSLDRVNDVCLDDADSGSSADDGLAAIGASLPTPEVAPIVETAIVLAEPAAIIARTTTPKPVGGKRDAQTDAWVAILAARKVYMLQHGITEVVDADSAFAKAYQAKEIDLPSEIYETVTRISRSTVARRRTGAEQDGTSALARKESPGRPK